MSDLMEKSTLLFNDFSGFEGKIKPLVSKGFIAVYFN